MSSPFRADIQALRALAVLLVLGFHVWPSTIRGGYVGVDVFFVISGYLITGHLVREVAATGRVDLPNFYARRARRLLPAASLTLVAVGIATYAWMPQWTWATVAADMAASTLYAENWMLVRRAVDYHAQDQAPSPLQHFWSLAVEEQFYLGWPLLVGGVAASWRRRISVNGPAWIRNHDHHHHKAASLLGGPPGQPPPRSPPIYLYAFPMASLCAISFVCAIFYTRADPAAGYFMTLTRLHELGLGGLVGVWAAGRVVPRVEGHPGGDEEHSDRTTRVGYLGRTLGATAGLLAIGGSGLLYSPHLHFPGFAALVPVLGTVAVIVAGEGKGADAHALTSSLAHPWLLYVGNVSYSLYLAHWPVVVVYPYMTGRLVDGFLADGVTVVAASLVFAHGCKLLWEDWFRGHAKDAPPHAPRKEAASHAQAALPKKPAGMLLQRTRSPLVGAAAMAALMAGATLSAAVALYSRSAPSRTHEDWGTDLPVVHTSALLPQSVTPPQGDAQRACADFFGANASHPYPGAEALQRGCPVPLNSITISEALALMGGATSAQIPGKPYPNALGTVPKNPQTPRGKIALMGDSHAVHWEPAFTLVGRRLGFKIVSLAKPSCPPSLALVTKGSRQTGMQPFYECQRVVFDAIETVLRENPSAVVLVANHLYSPANKEDKASTVAAGIVQVAERIAAAGIPVLYIKSTPRMRGLMPDCLLREAKRYPASTNASACSLSTASLPVGPLEEAAAMYSEMRMLSFDHLFCVNGTCPPVIGNVVVYADAHHLTHAFSQSLAPALEEQLLDYLPDHKNDGWTYVSANAQGSE